MYNKNTFLTTSICHYTSFETYRLYLSRSKVTVILLYVTSSDPAPCCRQVLVMKVLK